MFRLLKWFALLALISYLAACAPVRPVPTPAPAKDRPAPSAPDTTAKTPTETAPSSGMPEAPAGGTPEDGMKKPSPRALASLELTEQGRVMIENNRPDAAIRVLERAMNLYPQNGQNYFYLAEAWLRKGNLPQAKEFHRLAVIYLRDEAGWSSRLRIQELKIQNY